KVFDPGLKKNIEFMKGKGHKKPYFEYTPEFYAILTKREGCPFVGYKLAQGKAGAEAQKHQGNRALGWAHLAGAAGGATACVRYFWQMYPKSLEVGADGRVTVGLWPRRWERGHLFEGRVHRTHETGWLFHSAADAAGAEKFARAFNSPVYAICDPDWYVNRSDTFARAAVAGAVKYGTYDDWALTAVHEDYSKGERNYSWDSSIPVEREKYDEYGVWHFGDGSKGGGMWYFSQFGEFDVSYTLMLHGARSGDPMFWVRGEENARHIMGIPAHEGGYGHQWAESSHNWSRGLAIYYMMTGLYEAREALVDWLGEFHIKTSQGEFHRKNNAWRYNGRNAAWAIRGLWNMYDLTGEKKYLVELDRGLKAVRKRQNKSTGKYGGGNPMSFQMGTVVGALGEHYFRSRDEEALDAMLGMVEYFRARKGRGDWVSGFAMDGFAYAYLHTGYDKYRDLAEAGAAHMKKGWFGKAPHYRTGTASPKSWTSQMRNYQPYLYMKANPRKDAQAPKEVEDLAVTASGGGKVALTWTAPGNDGAGGGRAAGYQVKYASKAFAEEKSGDALAWWAARNAKGEPAPGEPGAKEKFEISGLTPGTYWFALKTRDGADNLSQISNVVKADVK
ncbi:MAG: fibronectin type III domain-containing protein, partial [Planctomycetota bacterium]